VLLAIENAPPGKKAWYGMFPQLGAPIGFILSTGVFLLLTQLITEDQFLAWGWRLPFLLSTLLVFVGLYVRLKLTETPAFQSLLAKNERVKVPMLTVCREHPRALVMGTFAGTATFVLFYLMTVFTLSWGTSALHYSRAEFLVMQMIAVVFFGLCVPLSARVAEGRGSRWMMIAATVGIIAFGFVFAPLFGAGSTAGVIVALCIGLALMGLTYGPIGTAMAELFPTSVRYTGASLTFNLAGIVGASLAPYIATWLATRHGLASVGYYLAAAGALTLCALLLMPRAVADPESHA
jgi:MFS family permease